MKSDDIISTILAVAVFLFVYFLGRWSVLAPKDAVVPLEKIEPIVLQAKTPLYALAELKMSDLLSTDYWSHTNSDGQTLGQRRKAVGIQSSIGEVLAKDYCTIDEAVEAWLKSPTHKDIIVDKSFNHAILRMERNAEHCYWVGEYSK